MLKVKFTVPLYDTVITILQIEKDDKWDNFRRHIPRDLSTDVKFEIRDVVEDYTGHTNGGWTCFNAGKNDIFLVFTGFTDKQTRASVIAHEKRHCEDDILKRCNIEDDEAAAFLAGYLELKFEPFRQTKNNIIDVDTSKENS